MTPQNYRFSLYFYNADVCVPHFMIFTDENDIPGIVHHEFSLWVFEYHYFMLEIWKCKKYKESFDCTFLNLHISLEWDLV